MVNTSEKFIPSHFRNLILLYIITWFIPRQVYLEVGSLDITPRLLVGMVLFSDIFLNNRVKWSRVDIISVVILVVNFVCMGISSGIGRATEATGRIALELTTAYLIGRSIAQRQDLMAAVLRVIFICLAILAPFLLIESLYRFNIHCMIWGYDYDPHREIRWGLTRAHGWTSHSIMLGITYAAFVTPALTVALDITKGKSTNWLIVALLFSGVFFSLSTGAWCVAFFGLLLMYFDRHGNPSRLDKWKLIGLSALAGYLALWLFSDNSPLLALMYHLNFLSSNWLYRWELWERVIEVMPGHWLFGYGENLPEEFTRKTGWSIDNHYLVLFIQQGWFGLGAWLAFNFAVLKGNIQHNWIARDDFHARLLRSFGFTLIGFIFSGLTVSFFSTAAVTLFFSMGMAATDAAGEPGIK